MNLAATLKAAKTAVTSKVGLQVLAAQKHSPTILFAAGAVGLVATAVLASRATLKLEDVLDEFEDNKEMIARARQDHPEKYSGAKQKQDSVVTHAQLILGVARVYAPAAAVGALTIGCFGGSHYILTKRNAALTAAYTAVVKSFDEYRARVVADVGKEKDRDYMYGTSEREVYSEGKKGEPIVETIKTFGTGRSPYAVVFDTSNPNWQKAPGYNAFFLKLTQAHANDMLKAKGHIFLNDVYRSLGLEDTEAGAVTGWIYGENGGDQFVDFGCWSDDQLHDIESFMMNDRGFILLDFNVDGAIFKNLKNKKG